MGFVAFSDRVLLKSLVKVMAVGTTELWVWRVLWLKGWVINYYFSVIKSYLNSHIALRNNENREYNTLVSLPIFKVVKYATTDNICV